MFQKSLKVSGNLIARSVDIRKEEQELIGDYYKNRTSPTNTESVSCVFSGEDGSFTLNTKMEQLQQAKCINLLLWRWNNWI